MVRHAGQTSFEVYVLQKGTWELHARYPHLERVTAVEEAKGLERQSFVKAVKVVKDSYDPDTGTSNEVVIYRSSGADDKMVASGTARGVTLDGGGSRGKRGVLAGRGGGWGGVPSRSPHMGDLLPDPFDHDEPKGRRGLGLLTKVLIIVIVSVAAAGLAGGIGSLVMRNTTLLSGLISARNSGNALFLIFLVTFIITSVTMSSLLISKEELDAPHRSSRKWWRIFFVKDSRQETKQDPVEKAVADRLAEAAAKLEQEKAAAEAPPPPEQVEEPEEVPSPEPEPEPQEEEKAPEEPVAPEVEENSSVESQKLVVMNFLGKALPAVKVSRPKLDNYNKFGINLFLAGVCEALLVERSLSRRTMIAVLSSSVAVLGIKKSIADTFAESYESYLLADKRYLQMFEAGRYAMQTFLKDPDSSTPLLEQSLNEWNKPKQQEDEAKPITVMFTDIVGSTDLTQERGDAVGQKVVRTHNRIVREALSRFSGREIKHTGDGIMASFESPAKAVEAAKVIQSQVYTHNSVDKDLPLLIRIGINTGKPIIEENDLFGSTVQLAARLCSHAGDDQIVVSQIVRDACPETDDKIVFRDLGDQILKGFQQPLPLHEVVWKTSAQEAAT
ncbi:MAG: adenylate/guanylate cyclase domain-containing protein, partial [Rhodospirillales bacterium]|nr:adenylate/guanylate cyclase domain-containing protein [Rhodospirillales bacterium]